jgi:predicted nucleotidyltransferase
MAPSAKADADFGLLASLEDSLARRVDLVEIDAITNPYFKTSVEASRVAFYAAA